MELYTSTSSAMSRVMTDRYSSSFGSATRLFRSSIRPHIYNIYGLVRLADEIVDTYDGSDRRELLDSLERETLESLTRHYSTNPVVHAFQYSANQFSIDAELISPFFESMRMDVTKPTHDAESYRAYIYGSAEVVGLMCLAVFCEGDRTVFDRLKNGASHLGAAYQKINFLRDMTEDYKELGRVYFPGINYAAMTEEDKQTIITDIRADLAIAKPAINELPPGTAAAVATSYRYYSLLLDKLERSSVDEIKQRRVRLSKPRKLLLLATTALRGGL